MTWAYDSQLRDLAHSTVVDGSIRCLNELQNVHVTVMTSKSNFSEGLYLLVLSATIKHIMIIKSRGGVSMSMRRGLAGMLFGFIFLAMLVSNTQAQMCGGIGGGMPGSGMMGGMGHQDMGMMHGMGGMMGCGMMMNDDHPMWKHLMGLGLDDKQKDSLKALRSKTMKDVTKKMADKKIAGIELRDLLDKDPVDMKAVEASVKKSESLRTEILLAHIKAHEEMKSILTPDQRKKMKEMMEGGTGAGCGMMGGNAPQMPMHEHMH